LAFEGAPLVVGQSAPDSRLLTALDGPCQTGGNDLSATPPLTEIERRDNSQHNAAFGGGISSIGIMQRMRRLLLLLVVIWLAVGAVAVGQRGYFGSSPQNCAGVTTIAVTVVAGPMNYLGVNPKITCRLPQPSS
jgi:hypothetical protein